MTAAPPVARVVPRPALSEATHRHPMATLQGVELIGLMVAAGEHWRPLTRVQQSAMRVAFAAVLAAVPDEVPDGGVEVELPPLPDVHPATVRSLERRGLAAGGRLTVLGMQVVQYGDLGHRTGPDEPPSGSP